MRRELPESLKGFRQHGVDFHHSSGGDQWCGTCPLCDKEEHFYASSTNRLWDCKACGESGNFTTFLSLVSRRNQARLRGKALRELKEDRGLRKSTLLRWEVGWNGKQYTIPVYDDTGKLVDLRRYNQRYGSQVTAGNKAWLIGLQHNTSQTQVYICEGEWDAMAMDENLRRLGEKGWVVGIPGANVFRPEWQPYFSGKDVVVVMDNDDPGKLGDHKVNSIVQNGAKSVQFTHWSGKLEVGFDFRDLYKARDRRALSGLHKMLQSTPRYHPGITTAKEGSPGKLPVLTGTGLSRRRVLKFYSKWLHLTDEDALDVLYGTVLANRIPGDPLWLMLVAPSGGCKTELLMSLDNAPLVVSLTSLTPHSLLSGSKDLGGGDPSLIPRLNGRVLVIKDFTTLLTMNMIARDEIFGILRDCYDGKTEKAFGTGLIRSYNATFGILAGVTPVVDTFATVHVSLGERFLKYRMRQSGGIQESSKDAIAQAMKNINSEIAIRKELQTISAQALGFPVAALPKVRKKTTQSLIGMAQWVAILRTPVVRDRYTQDITYRPSPEVGTRLAKQLTKLALGIALFRHEEEVTREVLQIVAKVTRDTIPGNTESVVLHLYLHRADGLVTTKQVAEWSRLPSGTVLRILEDLALLRVVRKKVAGVATPVWSLSKSMSKLTEETGVFWEDELWRKASTRK